MRTCQLLLLLLAFLFPACVAGPTRAASPLVPAAGAAKSPSKSLLPSTWRAHPPVMYRRFDINAVRPLTGNASPPYSPAEVVGAYELNSLTLTNPTGAGVTVAIVDAYGDTDSNLTDVVQSDLQTFCSEYGLPYSGPGSATPTLTEAFPGGTPTSSDSNWAIETALDVEWVHSIAPAARILLVVSPDNGDSLYNAVTYAAANAPIVSMSWGGGEFSGETSYDSAYFSAPGVTYFAATGDGGAGVIYPSISPNVTAIGGTSLTIDTNNNWVSETAWSGSGGGPSSYESLPSFQSSWVTTGNREVPDVSAIADPDTGVSVYQDGTWYQVGGTSLATPVWAAFTAIVDANLASPLDEATLHADLYNFGSPANINGYFHDIISGSNGYSAVVGYDEATGIGSPLCAALLPTLANTAVVPAPTISPNGGAFTGSVSVTLSDSLAGAVIRYTTDGSDPTTSATAQTYSIPFTLTTQATVSAVATASGYAASPVVSATFTSPPSNDNFVNRFALMGYPLSVTGTNVGATRESGEPYNITTGETSSVWWSWVAPSNGVVSVNTIGSDFDTTLGIYTGSAVDALTYIAADDDSGGSLTSALTFNAVAGTEYEISVAGYDSFEQGNILLNLNYQGTLTDLTLSPTTIYGGAPSYGKVTLSGPAPAGGKVVTLASSSSLVTLPASVTVPAGYTSATFAFSTAQVTSDTLVTITATDASTSQSANITLLTKYNLGGTVTKAGAPLPGASVTLSETGTFLLTKNLATVQAIPDNSAAGITQSIAITNVGTVSDLKLGVNITHPNVADLVVTLTGPDGTSVIVHNQSAGPPNLITDYPTLTAPDNSLSAFNGKAIFGTWTLKVQDLAGGNTGSLNAWDMTFTFNGSGSKTITTDSSGNYSFVQLKPAIYSVTPSLSGLTFSPTSQVVSVGPSQSGINFAGYSTPTVTSFTPVSGGAGTSVTVTGTGFTGATSVVLHGTPMSFTINSDTTITALVPSGATTGHIDVTTPGGTAVSPHNFTVVPGPAVTGFTPSSGPVRTSVTITGTNLTGATSVKFNGTAATTFTVNSSTQITATVPAGATTGTISVTTPSGTGTSASSFTVLLAPVVTGFTPAAGAVGTVVAITGSHFTSALQVKFNGTAATSFIVVSDTQINATVPNGATTGAISVTTPAGTGTSASSFTVYPPPTISGFTPGAGAVGTAVTLNGSGFTGTTSVTFNGVAATFTVVNDTQINTTVPSGATTGLITVTAPGGNAASATNFTVVIPPVITSLSPTSAYAGGSSLTLTVTGTGFVSGAVVKFGSTALTTTFVSSTQLNATITTTLRGTVGTFTVTVVNPGSIVSNGKTFTLKPRLIGLTLSASRVSGGQPVTGTVTLNGPAPTGGLAIALTSSDTSRATLPSSVTVPAGAASATFPVTTSAVTTTGGASIGANGAGGTLSVTLTVLAPLTPSADTFGQDGSSANTNFGTVNPLLVKTATSPGTNRDSYLKFSLAGFTTITSAKLLVTASLSGSGSLTTGVFGTSSGWTETGLTWNNRPALGSSLGSVTVTSTSNVVYSVDVTAYVQSQLGGGVASFGLHNPSASTIVTRIISRELSSGAAQLVITGN